MSDPRTKKTVHLNMISAEYNAACKKHPKFCDNLCENIDWNFLEKDIKNFNSKDPYYAESILQEEIAEAMNAYKKGEKEHALQELAQCGSVILRMMDYVQNEMDAKDEYDEFYLKSEADKVIAELEESHKKEVEQLLMEIVKLNEGAQNLILDDCLKAEKVRHSNYKRCLAMADMCAARAAVSYGVHWNERKSAIYSKWADRWLIFAEKFKDEKETLELVRSANTLCKEAK